METVAQLVEHMENVCSLPFNSSSLLWNGTRVNLNILHITGIIGRGFESRLSPKMNIQYRTRNVQLWKTEVQFNLLEIGNSLLGIIPSHG